jgi:threonine dehydrogenase-like Zn-dependent dehydrogenase
MRAVVYQEAGSLRVTDAPEPTVQHPADAVVRISAAAICGSDLHFYHGKAPLSPGDTIGHEGVGVVEETGPDVRGFRRGDRVVVAFNIVCGACWFCRLGETSLCEDFRNLGAGPFGGGLGGTQAEMVRVPNADVNLLPIPAGLEDERALFVGDVLTTAVHATGIAGIRAGATVAVVGAGPVGYFTVQAAHLHRPAQVVVLDTQPDRLSLAREAGAVPVNVRERNPEMALSELTEGRGADVVIEAVGSVPGFETALQIVRRGGTVVIVGMFVGESIEAALGVYWARALRLLFTGICPVHAWWERAMTAVLDGSIDPLPIISHRLPLSDAVRGYELFDSRRATKVVLLP